MVVVERVSIITIISTFIFYIITHLGIGLVRNNFEKKLVENPDNTEIQHSVGLLQILFKWYPFIYVIVILVLFLL